MKPSIGRTVIYHGYEYAGMDHHPAIVTRVFDTHDPGEGKPVLINATAFLNLGPTVHVGSVPLFETEQQAKSVGSVAFCCWPPRI